MIWKIVLQVLTVLVALLIANIDYLWYDKRTVKFKRARITLYVVLLTLLFVSIFVTVQDERDKAHQIGELTNRLDKITNQFTGGDSYCYIQFFFQAGLDNYLIVWLKNDGDYPLHDTQIRMVDLYKFRNVRWNTPMSEADIKNAETLITVGTIGPHTELKLGAIAIPAGLDKYGFNIWIHTRYKEFVQETRFKRSERFWRIGYQLFERTDQGKKLIFKQIPNQFLSTGSTQEIWKFTPYPPQ